MKQIYMVRPTLRQLDYLIAIEEKKSFSLAADSCNVTQSTLSAGIKDLENALGQQLVNRNGRNITLTPFGSEVSHKGRKILHDVDQIVTRAGTIKAPLSGPLRLGVIPTIAPYMLPQILPDIQKRFPALELQIHEDLSQRLVENLHAGKIDAILMAFPYDTKGLETHILFEEPFLLAAPENKDIPETWTLGSLPSEEILLLEDGHCLRDHAIAACHLQPMATRKTFSATSLPTLIQMVSHGYGMTLLPEMVTKSASMPENIAIKRFKKDTPTRTIGMAWSKNSLQKKDLELLFNAIRINADQNPTQAASTS